MKEKKYGRTELAQLYCPELTADAAWKKLKRWVTLNRDLSRELQALGYTHHQRTFTPKMIERIFYWLGEP